jgi:hypothetical protein
LLSSQGGASEVYPPGFEVITSLMDTYIITRMVHLRSD